MDDSGWAEYWDYTDPLPAQGTQFDKLLVNLHWRDEQVTQLATDKYTSATKFYKTAGDDSGGPWIGLIGPNGESCLRQDLTTGQTNFGFIKAFLNDERTYFGEERWIRFQQYLDPEWQQYPALNTTIAHNKWWRDNLNAIDPGTGQDVSNYKLNFKRENNSSDAMYIENELGAGNYFGTRLFTDAFPSGRWVTYEFYRKFGLPEQGNSHLIIWIDGAKVLDSTDIPLWYLDEGRPDRFYSLTSFHMWANWNGDVPKDQFFCIRDLAIALRGVDRDDSPYLSAAPGGGLWIGTEPGDS